MCYFDLDVKLTFQLLAAQFDKVIPAGITLVITAGTTLVITAGITLTRGATHQQRINFVVNPFETCRIRIRGVTPRIQMQHVSNDLTPCEISYCNRFCQQNWLHAQGD